MMKQGGHVSSTDRDHSIHSGLRRGFDAQADALFDIQEALTNYNDAMDAARSELSTKITAANAEKSRLVSEASSNLNTIRRSITKQADDTHAEIQSTFTTKLAKSQAERANRQHVARAAHEKAVGTAKSKREEAIWLADTVHESELRKELAQHKETLTSSNELHVQARALADQFSALTGRMLPELPAQDDLDHPSLAIASQCVQSAAQAIESLQRGWLGKLVQSRTKRRETEQATEDAVSKAVAATKAVLANENHRHATQVREIETKRANQIEYADREFRLLQQKSDKTTGSKIRESSEIHAERTKQLEDRRAHDLSKLERWKSTHEADAQERYRNEVDAAESDHKVTTAHAEEAFAAQSVAASSLLVERVVPARSLLEDLYDMCRDRHTEWEQLAAMPQPGSVPWAVPIGHVRLDLKSRLQTVPQAERDVLLLPEVFETPLVVGLPGTRSYVIDHDHENRDRALDALRAISLRVLSSFPAGKARFLIADPIGLGQSFAGFMSLSDQEPSAVGRRIWTDPVQIERQLIDMTEHMETVIQKYLRSDFETIEAYNQAAGEIAEPYRFVLISD
ncbi:MAG: hypothetical protein AAGB34_05405, partial [Planctomycetota bacterium]